MTIPARESGLTLWLEEKQHGFNIIKLGGEKFYKAFTALKLAINWSTDRLEAPKEARGLLYKSPRNSAAL